MNPVFKRVLDNLRRANTAAKQKMAENYGFKTVAEFEKYLTADPASNPTPPVPSPTKKKDKPGGNKKVAALIHSVIAPPMLHNVHILDASGSMAGGKIRSALIGINDEISELKKNPDAEYTTQTIIDFSYSGDIQTRMWKSAIKEAGKFDCVTRGSTALLEAIGKTLTTLLKEHKDGEKVLVKIFTDGQENDSDTKWKYEVVPELIKKCEKEGFVITFVGTSQDVKYAVNALHVKQSNTLVHDNTAAGVAKSFKKSIGATVSYRAAASRGIDTQENFFVDTND